MKAPERAAVLPKPPDAQGIPVPPARRRHIRQGSEMDIQLNLFEDLQFWTDNDLFDYQKQCYADLNNITVMHEAGLIDPGQEKEYERATQTLRDELHAIKSVLAVRMLRTL